MRHEFNTVNVHLMIWEINPRKRKENKKISFNEVGSTSLEVGDIIYTHVTDNVIGSWTIDEVKRKRPSSIKNMTYVEAEATFNFKSISQVEKLIKENKLTGSRVLEQRIINLAENLN